MSAELARIQANAGGPKGIPTRRSKLKDHTSGVIFFVYNTSPLNPVMNKSEKNVNILQIKNPLAGEFSP